MQILEFLLTGRGRFGKYSVLLISLVVLFLAQPLLVGTSFGGHFFHLLLCINMLSAVVVSGSARAARYVAWGLIVPAIVLTWITDSESSQWLISLSYVLNVAVLLIAVVSLTRDIYLDPAVSSETIVGAIMVYLLIGLAYALAYDWIAVRDPTSIPNLRDVSETSTQAHALPNSCYFSFVTLTTLGFGDISPVSPLARTLVWSEAIVGQLYLAVLVAGLVGKHVAGASLKRIEEDENAERQSRQGSSAE